MTGNTDHGRSYVPQLSFILYMLSKFKRLTKRKLSVFVCLLSFNKQESWKPRELSRANYLFVYKLAASFF